MAVWFIDGMDYVTGDNPADGTTLYRNDLSIVANGSRWGTNNLSVGFEFGSFTYTYGPGGTRVMGAQAFKVSEAGKYIAIYNYTDNSSAWIGFDGARGLTVTNWRFAGGLFGNDHTVIITADAGFELANGEWHWLEFDLDWSTSGTPTQRIAVDGNVIYNAATLLNTAPNSTTNITALRFENIFTTQGPCYLDDCIYWNDTDDGTPGCLTAADWPLGLKQFTTIRPSGDVTANFTPLSGGNNYAMVDEPDLDGNTTYNYVNAPASNTRDLFSYTNLSFLPLSILTVAAIDAWQNAGGGTLQMKAISKSAGVEMLGTAHNLGAGYATQIDMFYNDPSGNPWTGTTINGANFGYRTV